MKLNKKISFGKVSSKLNDGTKDVVNHRKVTSRSSVNLNNDGNKKKDKVEPFEILTGITNDSPEIILLTDFLPLYDDFGNLNSYGDVFQVKQDSLLVAANSSINSVLNSADSSSIINSALSNRKIISEFCDTFGKDIDAILKKTTTVKEKFDCRKKVENDLLLKMGLLNDSDSNQSSINKVVSSIEDLLFEKNLNIIDSWTATKAWIQLVLEVKESLKNGLPFLLSNTNEPPKISNSVYKSPYSIYAPRSSFLVKMNFSGERFNVNNLSFLSDVTEEDIPKVVEDIKSIFDLNSKNIFTQPVYSGNDIHESIAKLSLLLCKESIYSTQMDSKVLSDYNYRLKSPGGNQDIWDYFFGEAFEDITDIKNDPLGDGKSLVSLSQFVESDGSEVLTFEDSYIRDNIGEQRPSATITPGMFYYIESSLNVVNKSFDTARIESYVNRLNSSVKMITMLKKDLALKSTNPFLTITSKIANKSQSTGKKKNKVESSSTKDVALKNVEEKYHKDVEKLYNSLEEDAKKNLRSFKINTNNSTIENNLKDPIQLLRNAEIAIFKNTSLLGRKGLNAGLAATFKSNLSLASDYSAVIISTAIDDSELMSLLFLYVLNKNRKKLSNSYNQNTASASQENLSVTGNQHISEAIFHRLKKLFNNKSYDKNSVLAIKDFDEMTLQMALTLGLDWNRKTLDNIADHLQEYIEYFSSVENANDSSKKFFLSGINDLTPISKANVSAALNRNILNTTFSDKSTLYSGVQKTIYIAALFQLFCLIANSAISEKIVSASSGIMSTNYTIARVKNPVLNDKKVQDEIFKQTNENLLPLIYDNLMIKAESLLYDYINLSNQQINSIYSFLFSLQKELQGFLSDLKSNSSEYSKVISELNSLIDDPSLTRILMTKEQLMLIRSKLHDVQTRANLSYDSEIKRVVPYFLNLKDNSLVDTILPIEDVHLVSWNLALKSFFKAPEFRESKGFNKKIVSIGVPQRLHRSFRKNASKLSNKERSQLIKIYLFRINCLKPDLVYEPLIYLFDLKKFSTRVLKNYIDSGFSINGNDDIKLDKIPILNGPFLSNDSSTNDFFIVNDQNKSFENYEFLSKKEKEELIKNHSTSFLMEEYLNYFSGTSFDEHKYYRYDNIKKVVDKEFSKFIKNSTPETSNVTSRKDQFSSDETTKESKTSKYVKALDVEPEFSKSVENFFVGETFMSNVDSLKKSLIMPKKFDRVFHIVFDPDDFAINKNLTEDFVLLKYDSEKKDSIKGTISFDKYYAAIEMYDESE